MNLRLLLILGAGIFTILLGISIGRVTQPESYHYFADQRDLLILPNVWNVLSNLAFALAGLYGLVSLNKAEFIDRRERLLWAGVSIGLILTALGSSYYHLDPNNAHLVFDRLPMTVVFLSLIAILIAERISLQLALLTWPILIFGGVMSVLIWKTTGDLRYYLGVQVFTFLSMFVMLPVPSPYTRSFDFGIALMAYGFARLFEIYDHEIYRWTDGIISGHSLKHIAAAFAGFWLVRMMIKRKLR